MELKLKRHFPRALLKNKRVRRVVSSAGCLVLGFLLSAGTAVGSLHPFGIAFVAVSGKRYFPFSAAGAALGCLVAGMDVYAARYLCAVVLATLGALAAAAFDLHYRPAFSMLLSFIACGATGLLLNIRMGSPLPQYLLSLGEAILCSGCAFFFYRALHADYRRLRLRALPTADMICITVTAALPLMSLADRQIAFFRPALTVAAVLILLCVRYFDIRMAMAAALCFGFALSVGMEAELFIAGALAFSAMTAALFAASGSFACAGAFLAVNAFFAIAEGGDSGLSYFISSGIGTLIFVLLPPAVTDRLEEITADSDMQKNDGSLRQSLVLKLRFAGSAMAAISESVEQVREKISDITRTENENLRDSLSEEEYVCRELIREKTNQIRRVASDQFFSIADMLGELAFEFDEAETFDTAAAAKIRALLAEYDIRPKSVSVIEDKYARVRVEILTAVDTEITDNPRLTKDIGKICSRYFEPGTMTYFKDDAMLSFSEKPSYRLNIGFAQHSAEGALCGDTVKLLNDNRGHAILIISDGMGKGSRAALDGAMGAGLLSKLISAGFGFDSALRVVNCALLVKSNEESLATLDVACIDLFTGKCELLKAGAPASFLEKDGSITKCELASMPAGILRGIEFARRTAVLRPGNKIMMMSDGITDLGEEWLGGVLAQMPDKPPQENADHLLEAALARAEETQHTVDDMSVIIATLERN